MTERRSTPVPIDTSVRRPLPYVVDDGGRAGAGYRGRAGDCVTRALAIAGNLDYLLVYDRLSAGMAALGKPRSARNGVLKKVYGPLLAEWGWPWTPTMTIGSGTRVHLAVGELPEGRLVARCSRHIVAVIDGAVHDTHDPCRGGSRAVYGYWTVPEGWTLP